MSERRVYPKHNRITRQAPIRVCENCGRKFRVSDYNDDSPYCNKCVEEMEEENERSDRGKE